MAASKVSFAKQYTNYKGRVFIRFACGERIAELVMRADRQSLTLYTRAEAKTLAAKHFEGTCGGSQAGCPVTVHAWAS